MQLSGKKDEIDSEPGLWQNTRSGQQRRRGGDRSVPWGWGGGPKKVQAQLVPAAKTIGVPKRGSALGAVRNMKYRYLCSTLHPRRRPLGSFLTPRSCPAPASWPQRYPMTGHCVRRRCPTEFSVHLDGWPGTGTTSRCPFLCHLLLGSCHECDIGLQSGRRWGSSGPGTAISWCRDCPSRTSGWNLGSSGCEFLFPSPGMSMSLSCRVPNSGGVHAACPYSLGPRGPRDSGSPARSGTRSGTWLCAPREPRSGPPLLPSHSI
jgi:hypothetical protein